MIDNFKTIEKFLQFEQGTFYKFELLIRNTDGNNVLYENGYSNTNKNILIKSWYVDNNEYLQKIKNEMITMANLTGARLYITLDRKDNVKLVQNLIKSYTDTLCAICNGQKPSIKNIAKTFASETSKVENSSKSTKTIMFDVDTKSMYVTKAVREYIESRGVECHVLETKKGYHMFCYRKFNHQDWELAIKTNLHGQLYKTMEYDTELEIGKYLNIKEYVSVKENELGLVYHPEKNNEC